MGMEGASNRIRSEGMSQSNSAWQLARVRRKTLIKSQIEFLSSFRMRERVVRLELEHRD